MAIDYRNKFVLAPMVRVSTLPMRLLSLKHGADLVYCEEIIDFKILNSERQVNDILGTIDYVLSDGHVVFRTCPQEKDKVIFQLGTCDAERAVAAALKVEKDVAGIDVNMGCPKEFSIKGGMGAALLKQPEKVKQLEETIELAKTIEGTGVSALTVHGRTKEERPRHPNRNDYIRKIAECLKIPVIANGGSKEILNYPDIQKFADDTGCSSVMIARAAEWNPSIFNKDGIKPLLDTVREYIKMAIDWDNNAINTKYCILQMMHKDMDIKEGDLTLSAVTMEEISDIWGLKDHYDQRKEYLAEQLAIKFDKESEIRIATDDDGTMIEIPLRFIKKEYPPCISPKQRIYECLKRVGITKLHYDAIERKEDRCFNCILTVSGNKYRTPFWEKSKQLAEQASAMVAATVLQIDDDRQFEIGGQNEAVILKWKKYCDNVAVQEIYNKYKQRLDKLMEEKKKNKRSNAECSDSCIEKKHFISDNNIDAVS